MEKRYILSGCGFEYTTESELKKRYELNLANNGNKGWASEYKSFEDFLAKGIENGNIK